MPSVFIAVYATTCNVVSLNSSKCLEYSRCESEEFGCGSCGMTAVNGYQLYYEREVPFELRSALGADSPNEVGVSIALQSITACDGQRPA